MASSKHTQSEQARKGASEQMRAWAVVIAWFVLNTVMGSSTKWLFMYGEVCVNGANCRKFNFPLTITVIHMFFSWCVCYLYIFHWKKSTSRPILSFSAQAQTIAPLAFCFALSVSMGNMSLKYIFPSFNQMLGALTPIITVAMAILFQRKRYNLWTWIAMPIICGGLSICSALEANFHVLGALLALGATVLRAAKSLIQAQILAEKMDSVTLLFYMAPWAAALLSVMALFSEGFEPIEMLFTGFKVDQPADSVEGVGNVIALLCLSGMNACLLNITNFLVTAYTSAVTLQVLGNVKNCVAIVVSVAIFGNEISSRQAMGVVACLFGVWLYNAKGGAVKKPEPPPPSKEELKLRELEVELGLKEYPVRAA